MPIYRSTAPSFSPSQSIRQIDNYLSDFASVFQPCPLDKYLWRQALVLGDQQNLPRLLKNLPATAPHSSKSSLDLGGFQTLITLTLSLGHPDVGLALAKRAGFDELGGAFGFFGLAMVSGNEISIKATAPPAKFATRMLPMLLGQRLVENGAVHALLTHLQSDELNAAFLQRVEQNIKKYEDQEEKMAIVFHEGDPYRFDRTYKIISALVARKQIMNEIEPSAQSAPSRPTLKM